MQGRPFYYFAYGAAVSEVVVDTLTGECRVLAAHLLHDAGRSLNPAIDIGQVEGGFIQGMGWLTMEELVWHPNDGTARAGLLVTHAPSTYKIPTANDCPPVFDVRLWKDGAGDGNVAETIHRSKATGEPPLLLPFSVFFAIRDAGLGGGRTIASTRRSRRRRRASRSCARSAPCRRGRRERAAPARSRRRVARRSAAGGRRRGRRRARLGAARRRHANARRRPRNRSARSAAVTSS
jgi:hypothetical protein